VRASASCSADASACVVTLSFTRLRVTNMTAVRIIKDSPVAMLSAVRSSRR
jgi:hypothetical protein